MSESADLVPPGLRLWRQARVVQSPRFFPQAARAPWPTSLSRSTRVCRWPSLTSQRSSSLPGTLRVTHGRQSGSALCQVSVVSLSARSPSLGALIYLLYAVSRASLVAQW